MVDKRQVCASSSAGFSGLVPKACRFALMLSIPRCLVVQRSVRVQCSGIQPAGMPSACGTQGVQGCKAGVNVSQPQHRECKSVGCVFRPWLSPACRAQLQKKRAPPPPSLLCLPFSNPDILHQMMYDPNHHHHPLHHTHLALTLLPPGCPRVLSPASTLHTTSPATTTTRWPA